MNAREVLTTEPFLLEQCNGERITNRQRRRGARRRGEVVRACLLAHPRIECDVRVTRERRLDDTGERDGAHTELPA